MARRLSNEPLTVLVDIYRDNDITTHTYELDPGQPLGDLKDGLRNAYPGYDVDMRINGVLVDDYDTYDFHVGKRVIVLLKDAPPHRSPPPVGSRLPRRSPPSVRPSVGSRSPLHSYGDQHISLTILRPGGVDKKMVPVNKYEPLSSVVDDLREQYGVDTVKLVLAGEEIDPNMTSAHYQVGGYTNMHAILR